MKLVEAADVHGSAFGILQTSSSVRLPMSLFALALKERTIFGNRAAWMKTFCRAVEPAVSFEADQAMVAQILASTQELWCCITPVGNHNDLTIPKEGPQCSQLFNGHLHCCFLCRDASCVQNRSPTAWSLWQEHHIGVLPPHAQRLLYQGQVRQMDVATVFARLRFGAFYHCGIYPHIDRFPFCHLCQQCAHKHLLQLITVDASIF